MSYRFLVTAGVLAAALMAPASGQAPKLAADGHPDLQGIWTNETITPLERPLLSPINPRSLTRRPRAYEKSDAEELKKVDGASEGPLLAAAGSSGTGGYNILFIDRGSELARVDGVKRTSLIVDPPDGRSLR